MSRSTPKLEARYWQERLLRRRYHFPASGESEQNFAAFIEHAGAGYFFPLGTADIARAAARALEIYRMAAEQGWGAACRHFARELIVSFEWCLNPVLWTYTTIHTLVGKPAAQGSDATPPGSNRQRVLLIEPDVGIRRALCWCINQQAEFISVPSDSAESLARAITLHKPRLVLVNSNLARRAGLNSTGAVTSVDPGVPAIAYSVHVDGDQMFVSTPGGAAGYLVKRVKADRLLDPIIKVAGRAEMTTEDLLLSVKYYFQELLQLPSGHDSSVLAKLTRREREVLELLSKGHVDKEIAEVLGISVWTVHGHLKNIFERLHVRTRTEAVVRYLEK